MTSVKCTPRWQAYSTKHFTTHTATDLAFDHPPNLRRPAKSQHPCNLHLSPCRVQVRGADLCSPWHPDCLLAAPGGVPWLRSCGVSSPRSAAGPWVGCWTRLHTNSSTSQPLCHRSRWSLSRARAGQGQEVDTPRGLRSAGWKVRNLGGDEAKR